MRRIRLLAGFFAGMLALAGCGLPQVLSPSLPASQGTVSVGKKLSQPFYSPASGLEGVTVAVAPPLDSGGDLQPQPTGGATLSLRYAPEADNRFPGGAFHDWPASDQWLGELTGHRQIGQSFLSRYPNLNGITLRVATYGADTGSGKGMVKPGASVDVLSLPIDGKVIASVPGGATIAVDGAAEGWAHVKLDDGRDGYIALDRFAQLPQTGRKNTHDVILTLYRESDMSEVRRVTINAADMHDNSHVTFNFPPIADSNGQRYRLALASPDSTPGNAVTFRYDPTTVFDDGLRYDDDQSVGGALVFRPTFAADAPLCQGKLDDFEWSSLSNAFIGSFKPIAQTNDRFLTIDVVPGSRVLNVDWSLARPSGGQPMVVDGNDQSPGGGLVFNVRYRDQVSLSGIIGDSARSVWRDTRGDPLFFVPYLIVMIAVVALTGLAGAVRWRYGH